MSFSTKTFDRALVRGDTPDVFGLPDTRASVVRVFSGGLLFAGGDTGGKLYYVSNVDDLENSSELGQLIPQDEIKMDARYGIYDLTVLEETPNSARFMYSYPRDVMDNNLNKLQVVFKEATIEYVETTSEWTLDENSIVTRYESQPPVATDGAHHGSGKIARIDSNSVYVSVGDQGSGIVSTRLENPGSEGDLGHILKLTINGSTVTRTDVSKGHRNIQGLVFASNRLIATEHGPKGGDEINVINLQEVVDYGWPYVTLGDPYDTNLTEDPRNYATIGQTQTHDDERFEKPIYSWNPSIAPTEILYLSDLDMYVMGTLREKTIYVFNITETNQVSYPFEIPVNVRIRSLTVSGTSVIGSSDEGTIVILEKNSLPNTLHVSYMNGNDANNGSEETPFQTINKALTSVRNGGVIKISSGTYNEKLKIDKSISLYGLNKETTIIKSDEPIQLIQGSSSTVIQNISILGKYSSTDNMYLVNDSNNINSGINVYTEGNVNIPIDNIVIDNVHVSKCGNGINFNNISSTNIIIKNSTIEDNAGVGVRISSNVATMDGFTIDNCIIRENNLNAINSNPSGKYHPNCTNYLIRNTIIHNNNRLTANNSHDISMFGFNGNLEMSHVDVLCNHDESKAINETTTTAGGWGLIIYGSNQGNTLRPAGDIKLNNVVVQGTVIKSVFGIDRYSSFSADALCNNVDVQNCKAGWVVQVILSSVLDLGTMKLRTIAISNVGDLDARKVIFYHVETGELLDRNNETDLLQIEKQITDRFDRNGIGKIIFTVGDFISSKEPTPIENALELNNNVVSISSEFKKITMLTGQYYVKTPILYNKISSAPVLMNTVGGRSLIVRYDI